jgi:hypothetical protein
MDEQLYRTHGQRFDENFNRDNRPEAELPRDTLAQIAARQAQEAEAEDE